MIFVDHFTKYTWIYFEINHTSLHFFQNSKHWWKNSSTLQLSPYTQMVVGNTRPFNPSLLPTVFNTLKFHPTLLNIMARPKDDTVILLKLGSPYSIKLLSLFCIGHMPFSQPHTSSTDSLHPFSVLYLLLRNCFPNNHDGKN